MSTRLLVATAQPYGIPLALRDAGFEVIYVGEQSADALIAAARQEDVAAVVMSQPDPEVAAAGVRVVEVEGRSLADLLAQLQ